MSVEKVSTITSYGEHINTEKQNELFVGSGTVPDDLHTTNYTVSVSAIDDAGNQSTINEPVTLTVTPRWITPKTNWACYYDSNGRYIGDFFEIEDWRRIIGNLYYLKELADKMYPYFAFNDMGDKKQYSDIPYANEWNAIERNLDLMIKHTYKFSIGKTRTYYPEMPAVNYDDLNRIESACLTIYEGLTSQYDGLRVLAFTLGGDEFGD